MGIQGVNKPTEICKVLEASHFSEKLYLSWYRRKDSESERLGFKS